MLHNMIEAAKLIDKTKLVKVAKFVGTIATIGGGLLTTWAGNCENKAEITKQVNKFMQEQAK